MGICSLIALVHGCVPVHVWPNLPHLCVYQCVCMWLYVSLRDSCVSAPIHAHLLTVSQSSHSPLLPSQGQSWCPLGPALSCSAPDLCLQRDHAPTPWSLPRPSSLSRQKSCLQKMAGGHYLCWRKRHQDGRQNTGWRKRKPGSQMVLTSSNAPHQRQRMRCE